MGHTISGTEGTAVWNWRYEGWGRPIWTLGFPGDEFYRRYIYPGIVWLQVSRDVNNKTTPRRRHNILSGLSQLCDRGDTPVRSERHRVPTDDGGLVLIHCQILPGAGRKRDNLGRGGEDGKKTKGGRAYCCGELQLSLEVFIRVTQS